MSKVEEVIKSPLDLVEELAITQNMRQKVSQHQNEMKAVLDGRDQRLVILAGPCSIHNIPAAMEYAERLKKLADRVSDEIKLVMRCYFEKPRTTLGWKGLIYDPYMDESCDIATGIKLARKLLLDLADMGLGTATELLDPTIANYLADLICWGGIGARTTESPMHRQMASSLDIPIGFKNSTDGNLQIAVDAICAASASHNYIGVTSSGHCGIIHSDGNPYCHLVLRGGSSGENYYATCVAAALRKLEAAKLAGNIVIDCSHGNSRRDPARQQIVFEDVLAQRLAGNNHLLGMMLESNLFAGKQKMVPGVKPDARISITDACIGFDETEKLILAAAEKLYHKESHAVAVARPQVAYPGPAGTFAHEASRKVFADKMDYLPCAGIESVFKAVENGDCEFGCVPVENSSDGVVSGTLDMLAGSSLKVYAETALDIHLSLLANCSADEITVVYSQAQAFGQCRQYLEKHLPGVETFIVSSHARAAELAAMSTNAAVIGSEKLASQYHLNILARNIEDSPDNRTRYLILSRGEANPMPHTKSCICFAASERFGALHDCLAPFKKAGVTLSMIESRPAPGGKWRYRFFIDIEGAADSPKVAASLEEMRPLTDELTILGSYPVIA